MDHVARRLSEAHQTNVDGHWYVPRLALDQILNKNTISNIVSNEELTAHNNDPALAVSSLPRQVDKIHSKAKRAFAILIHLGREYLRHIVDLFRHGDFMYSEIDHHLPLTKDVLLLCKFDMNHAGAFQSAQWHFIAPKIELGFSLLDEFR